MAPVLLAADGTTRTTAARAPLTSPTVAQWLDDWQRIKKADGLRTTTLRFYSQLIETHVNPAMGRKRLDKLTPAVVRDFISAKSETNLSPATVAHLLRLLRNTLGEAERLDLVTRNVAKAVRMPRSPPAKWTHSTSTALAAS
jgi:site-specific recombinase XerC